MIMLEFQWDAKKAASNKKKHGISFAEGKSVFYDENARVISDPDSTDHEADGDKPNHSRGPSNSSPNRCVVHRLVLSRYPLTAEDMSNSGTMTDMTMTATISPMTTVMAGSR